MKIDQMPVLIDLVEMACFIRLCWLAPLGTLCLEIASSEGIWLCAPVFFSGRLVSEGALQSSVGY
jgi:hypothetical protein